MRSGIWTSWQAKSNLPLRGTATLVLLCFASLTRNIFASQKAVPLFSQKPASCYALAPLRLFYSVSLRSQETCLTLCVSHRYACFTLFRYAHKKMSETLGLSPTFGRAIGEVKPATLSHRFVCFTGLLLSTLIAMTNWWLWVIFLTVTLICTFQWQLR